MRLVKLSKWLPMAVLLFAAPAAADVNYYRPTVVGDGAITASNSKDHELDFNILYRNTANHPVNIVVKLPTASSNFDVTFSIPSNPVAAGEIKPLIVVARGADISKLTYVDIRGVDAQTHALVSSDVRKVTLPASYFPFLPVGILTLPLLIAFAMGSAIWGDLKAKRLLRVRMGAPSFDLTKSWVSNLAVASALLTAGLAQLPDPPGLMAKGTYQELSLLFTILVAVAPMFFLALQYSGLFEEKTKLVRCFVVSSMITLLATLGQLATLSFALYEVSGKASAPFLIYIAIFVIALLLVGDLIYTRTACVNQVLEVAAANTEPKKAAGGTGHLHFKLDDWNITAARKTSVEAEKIIPTESPADRPSDEEEMPDLSSMETVPARWTPL